MSDSRGLRLSVVGTGYLGATHAIAMAEAGFDVIGLDRDVAKIESLRHGVVPFYEPGLQELLLRQLDTGRLAFTTSFQEAADFADVHFISVGTPESARNNAADLRQVNEAIDTLAPLLSRPATVVGKSTVPVGTAGLLAQRLRELAPTGIEVSLVWNPEFLREGLAVEDTLRPDRIVVGVEAPGSDPGSIAGEAVMRNVYRPMVEAGSPFLVMDFASAEMVKVAANSFLATKISFINAMAEICEATGADVTKIAEAIGYDERIGSKFLRAGIGFGGGCLPKDIRAFMARAGELGLSDSVAFLRDVDAINRRRRSQAVSVAREMVGGRFVGRRVAVLGAAFKPESDDVRDSPALDIAASIYTDGGEVRVHDPRALKNARAAFPNLHCTDTAGEALQGADLVLLLTEWDEYLDMDPVAVGEVVGNRQIIDGRNALDPAHWRAAGWTYRGLGRPRA